MKIVGENKIVTLTPGKVEYWLAHQKCQRRPIPRHYKALAKLLRETGWRADQRICLTERDELLNGLQRISAIKHLGDYGWKIPCTFFRDEEITLSLVESFNVQKADTTSMSMRRLYGWTDKRMSMISGGIWRCIKDKENPTASDYFDIYQNAKEHIDPILSIKEKKNKGDKSISVELYISAVCCSTQSLDLDSVIKTFNDFVNHNESGKVWKEIRDWKNYLSPETETGGILQRVAVRFYLLKSLILGERMRKIQNIESEEMAMLRNECRENLRRVCLMDEN